VEKPVITRRFISQGRVQGVGYRWFVQKTARQLGLKGEVRNLPDGTVETIARGSEAALNLLKKSLKEGPPLALVEQVLEQTISTEKEYHHFEVSY